MAVFGKSKGGERPAASPAARNGAPRGGDGSISIIGTGMAITGDLVTDGTVRVEGRIEGTVRAAVSVLVSKDGEVQGDVITQDAVIGGRVRGTVVAETRLVLQATSDIEGQIHARAQHLHLEEGARFNGQIHMLDGGAAEPLRALPAGAGGENSPKSDEFSTY
ncbi:MAG TPA: polymer-forming cytoskeletal protein [Longimicrobiaceae bacterium]|nr:polymer-forming cytoskeletal protein [Longimicrobiaceae bacterium]